MWARKFEQCVVCGRTDRPHMAKGKCSYCYSKEYQTEPGNTDQVRQAKRRWYEQNGGKELAKKNREDRWFGGLRQKILDRDGWRCQECGGTTHLVVHHKDGNGRGSKSPNNDETNLVTSCRSCHPREHQVLDRWSKEHDCCKDCGTTEIAHNAKGLCRLCYAKQSYRKTS